MKGIKKTSAGPLPQDPAFKKFPRSKQILNYAFLEFITPVPVESMGN